LHPQSARVSPAVAPEKKCHAAEIKFHKGSSCIWKIIQVQDSTVAEAFGSLVHKELAATCLVIFTIAGNSNSAGHWVTLNSLGIQHGTFSMS